MRILDLFENDRNIIDNVKGWGAVPNNQEVDYLGLRVTMTPKNFVDLAAPLSTEPSDQILQHLKQGGAIGAPFLIIKIPESWEDGDFSMPATVVGHEGRNRMIAVAKVFGNNPVETHLFFSQGLRNRHITDDFKKHLNRGLVKEKSKTIIKGPFFKLNESAAYNHKKETLNRALEKNVEVDLRGNADRGYVLNKIKVPAAERSQGIGTKVMQQIVDRMDREGAVVALTPDTAFGGTKNRLIDFYKRFGFVPNKGRNKDYGFRETMIRYPRNKTERTQQNEAFDTEAKWVLGHNGRNLQIFATKVDDAYIELSYKRIFPADVYIEFTRGGRLGVTGEGNQNKIFGAVINHIKQWVDKNKPNKIMFSALKLHGDTSRSNLYKRMVQRFASQNGYEFEIQDTGNEDTFILTKKESKLKTIGNKI